MIAIVCLNGGLCSETGLLVPVSGNDFSQA